TSSSNTTDTAAAHVAVGTGKVVAAATAITQTATTTGSHVVPGNTQAAATTFQSQASSSQQISSGQPVSSGQKELGSTGFAARIEASQVSNNVGADVGRNGPATINNVGSNAVSASVAEAGSAVLASGVSARAVGPVVGSDGIRQSDGVVPP